MRRLAIASADRLTSAVLQVGDGLPDRGGGQTSGRGELDEHRPAVPRAGASGDVAASFQTVQHPGQKYVASRGRPNLLWAGSTQLGLDLAGAVREIRDRHEHVKVVGSLNLVQTLLREKLFDRLDLWVHPIAVPGATTEAAPRQSGAGSGGRRSPRLGRTRRRSSARHLEPVVGDFSSKAAVRMRRRDVAGQRRNDAG